MDFAQAYSTLLADLSRLLRIDLSATTLRPTRPVEANLLELLRYERDQQWERADWQLAKLKLLVKQLETIQAYDRRMATKSAKLLKHEDRGEYIGTRMEVATAAFLIEHSVPFSWNPGEP